jgi:predicted GIY-YIG superfamily endonuclease
MQSTSTHLGHADRLVWFEEFADPTAAISREKQNPTDRVDKSGME